MLVCARHDPDELPSGRAAHSASFVAADIRDPEASRHAVVDRPRSTRFAALGIGLDVVVNNAGGSPSLVNAATASPRVSTRIIELNLLAPLHIAQARERRDHAAAGRAAARSS